MSIVKYKIGNKLIKREKGLREQIEMISLGLGYKYFQKLKVLLKIDSDAEMCKILDWLGVI